MATVVGVVVKDEFIDEHLTPTHISHRSLSQYKPNCTRSTVGFTQTYNECDLLAGQSIDGAIGQPCSGTVGVVADELRLV